MTLPENNSDEPVTPAGRLFLRPEMDTIIHCAIGLKNHLDIDAFKTCIKNSVMIKHPRFCSLLIRDEKGKEHWRRTEVDIDRHFIVVKNQESSSDDDEESRREIINEYIADLSVSTPLSPDKPLWEVHMLGEQNCVVFRIHHALGDGVSLMSMLLANCRKADDPTAVPTMVSGGRRGSMNEGWRAILRMVLWSLVYCVEFVLRALWVRDRRTVISGGDGVELWPRKMATARFLVEDMKLVKNAVANATINDVLFGVVSAGLSRYLDHRSIQNYMQDGLRLTGVAMVNLRQQPGLQELSEMMERDSGGRWGNKFGILLLPIFYHKSGNHTLKYVKRAKEMIERKKQTLEAHFSYQIGHLFMSWFGSKVAYLLNYRIICNTTFTISNVVGPKEEITIVDNPITFIRVNTSSIPHALTMHMVSYAGRADMQILVAKDIIPDPQFLAKCFEDALLQMKDAALATLQ